MNRQVGSYRFGPHRQQLRKEVPELDGLLTPDFPAIWRIESGQGAPASVLNSRREARNDLANGRRFQPFLDEQLPVAAANSMAPIVAPGVTFNESWLIPGTLNNGLSVAGSPEFLMVNNLAADATIVNPEPSTYVLTIGGLVAMAVMARRRRAKT